MYHFCWLHRLNFTHIVRKFIFFILSMRSRKNLAIWSLSFSFPSITFSINSSTRIFWCSAEAHNSWSLISFMMSLKGILFSTASWISEKTVWALRLTWKKFIYHLTKFREFLTIVLRFKGESKNSFIKLLHDLGQIFHAKTTRLKFLPDIMS